MSRVVVSTGCAVRCPSCVACPGPGPEPAIEEVLGDPATELVLGGGDATRFSGLAAVLEQNRTSPHPKRLWLEAPARALPDAVLGRLATQGLFGVVVQIEAMGEAMCRALGVGDGERVIATAEKVGLATQARLCVRPKTFPIVFPLARALAPRPVALELVRNDWGKSPVPIPVESIDRLFRAFPHLTWSTARMGTHGYLPPCTLPDLWRARPELWRRALRQRSTPQDVLDACTTCALRGSCSWDDPEALDADAKARAVPIGGTPWLRHTHTEVPEIIVRKRRSPEIACVTPWTTMEIVDPDGRTRQCCSTWTIGDRGNAHTATLEEIWNGEGYRRARRAMASGSTGELCNPICSRLYDAQFAESRLRIQGGSARFVENQLLLAEDIAERRELARGKPLRLAVCTSTYCNYDCIMCDYGRIPRRELPDRIFEEIVDLLPTLQSLTLLGGEPLANPKTMRFLRDFDVARYPDVAVDFVTNGSLLTARVLEHMTRCTLGDVTISFNAGTAEAYAHVQRGIAFEQVLRNLDDLLAFRGRHHRWFGITLSFVLQPAAAHTLLDFAQIAHARDLRIRLMALNIENHVELDFYMNDEAVSGVVRHVDELRAFAARHRPEWLPEVTAGRSAVLEEAARRKREAASKAALVRRLPILS
jgi:pyruvate-formate lyase-activating enzyme